MIPLQLFALRICDIKEEVFCRLKTIVSHEKRIKMERYLHYKDALRTLLGELLIRGLLITTFQIQNEDIQFSSSEYGKPFVLGLLNFHFNISHSGDWIICAIDQHPIGVDIEHIKDIDLTIAEKFFAGAESEILRKTIEEEKKDKFFELWTLKESYVKALGYGLTLPLDSFAVVFENHKPVLRHIELTCSQHFLKLYHFDNHYKLSVCSLHPQFPEKVNIINMKSLLDLF